MIVIRDLFTEMVKKMSINKIAQSSEEVKN